MTTDVKVATSAALHAELLAAAGPELVLTSLALRRVLMGTDRALIAEALNQVLQDGVTLPPAVAASFGVPLDGTVISAPSGPDRVLPALPPVKVPAAPELPAVPAQRVPGPRFAIELGPDSRLDLTALTVRTLRPEPTPAAPPAPTLPTPSVRDAVDVEDAGDLEEAAFADSSVPQPSFDSLNHYRAVISKHKLLSRNQEAELAQAIEAGLLAQEELDKAGRKIAPKLRRELEQLALLGEDAFSEFACSNLRLVVRIAVGYTGHGLDFMDLIQEGNLGMLHAIEKFDHRKGFKFSTYATHWIRQAIQRALADKSRTVRLPVHAHDAVAALRKAARELGHGTPADVLPAVAAGAGMSREKAAELLSQVRHTVSLEGLTESIGDDALHEEADRTIRGPHCSESDTLYKDLSPTEVHHLLGCLSDREHRLITLRYGLDGGPESTLDAIGQVLGVTRERVRQVESKAMSKLRTHTWRYLQPPLLNPPSRAVTPPPPTAEPHTAPVDPPVDLADELYVTRKVNHAGQIRVDQQTIFAGVQYAGEIVTVLLEDEWFRVLFGGHPVAATPRQNRPGASSIHVIAD
ncbi:sigma-70 family RNA polymerase sigma factor [Streptomyces sp. BRB040]|uniref:sigma-70 family RNA polymerase sigma factor n=1 Tax=Streptomyces sp. BRB040 TaxID=3142634 RepID=UPI0031F65032